MAKRRVANPKILLPVAAVALVLFSVIAIVVAVGHTPRSESDGATETSTLTVQPSPR